MNSKLDLKLSDLVPYFNFETGHSQTLIAHFVPTPDFVEPFEVRNVIFSDGDQCALKVYKNTNGNRKNIVLSVYHGLAGDHQSDYMQRAARVAFDLGWTVVLVDHRGAGLAEGKAKFPYHSGRGDDVSDILQFLKTEFSGFIQVANGYSMSGSILLNLLTGRKGTCQPDYAIVVNAPIDLLQASMGLAKGLSRLYDIRFYQKLKQALKKNHQIEIPFNGHTYDVDDLFTSVKSGYKNKEDYYEQCSTYKYVESIKTPTFILTAQDDPFVLFERYQNLKWPSCVHLTYSKCGGHMGYFSKNNLVLNGINFKKRWMDQYLYQVFGKIEENNSNAN
jgi:predicted alpha/beta-fold hydrolase